MTMPSACRIIAEAGVNHNGSPELAFRLVDAAVEAGADVIKFQTFKADALVDKTAVKAAYQARATGGGESQHAMLKRLELSDATFRDLAAYCLERGITFLSTPFDVEAARFLAGLGVSLLKIPSGEITNLPYLRALGGMGLPVILSTGMADLGEVEAALNVLAAAGCPWTRIVLLHCTTAYPTPLEEVNLLAMRTLGAAFPGVEIGYSDHTEGIAVPVAAVAMGARVIEKHFTLDRNMAGPDHRASLEPAALADMVRAVRAVETAMGDGVKRPTATELQNRRVARKSLVAARDIPRGATIVAADLAAKRPGSGMSPMRWDDVVGSRARRDYAEGDPI